MSDTGSTNRTRTVSFGRLVLRRRSAVAFAVAVAALAVAGVAIGVSLLTVNPPRFSPANHWYVGSTPAHSCVGAPRDRCVMAQAWASTVPCRDCADSLPPHKTLATLPADGIVIQVLDARERPPYGARGAWPAQIRAADVIGGPINDEPASVSYVLRVVRSPHNVEHFLYVWFGRRHPTPGQLAKANAELRTYRSWRGAAGSG